MITIPSRSFIKYYPQQMILLSLIISAAIGSLILALPICQLQPVSFIDLFFTAASITTVTGFMTVPITHFSHIGHIVMLCLMQLGGLGLMTLSLYFIYMFSNLGIYTQVIASEVLSLKSFKDTKRILFFIIKLTFIAELIGAILIFPTLYQTFPLKKALFLSIFHSVASFCNAGFSLFPNGFSDYTYNPFIIFITIGLMIVGGLGFVTWHEISMRHLNPQPSITGMSWHTKLVLRVYLYTSAISAIFIWMTERNHSLAQLPWFQKIYVVIFHSISMKSTGFLLMQPSLLQLATLVIFLMSMFIGTAPLSTGSGIKTNVFAIYLAIIKAAIQGKRHVLLYGRQIIDDQVYKAIAIILLSLSWIVVISFCLLIVEPNWNFLDVVFNTFAAFSNNGTSLGDMSIITNLSKCFIILSMLIGRIGALALILSMKRIHDMRELSYPKEHVILG